VGRPEFGALGFEFGLPYFENGVCLGVPITMVYHNAVPSGARSFLFSNMSTVRPLGIGY
jgi:hypothetical protein